jgi:hypothetical protein
MKEIVVVEKKIDLQTISVLFYCQNSSQETTDLAKIGGKFPCDAKLEAFTVFPIPPYYRPGKRRSQGPRLMFFFVTRFKCSKLE